MLSHCIWISGSNRKVQRSGRGGRWWRGRWQRHVWSWRWLLSTNRNSPEIIPISITGHTVVLAPASAGEGRDSWWWHGVGVYLLKSDSKGWFVYVHYNEFEWPPLWSGLLIHHRLSVYYMPGMLQSWKNCWENCILGKHFSKHRSCTGSSLSPFPWKHIQKKAWSLDVCGKQHWIGGRGFLLEIVLLRRKVVMMGKTFSSSFVRDCSLQAQKPC